MAVPQQPTPQAAPAQVPIQQPAPAQAPTQPPKFWERWDKGYVVAAIVALVLLIIFYLVFSRKPKGADGPVDQPVAVASAEPAPPVVVEAAPPPTPEPLPTPEPVITPLVTPITAVPTSASITLASNGAVQGVPPGLTPVSIQVPSGNFNFPIQGELAEPAKDANGRFATVPAPGIGRDGKQNVWPHMYVQVQGTLYCTDAAGQSVEIPVQVTQILSN